MGGQERLWTRLFAQKQIRNKDKHDEYKYADSKYQKHALMSSFKAEDL